MRFVCFVPRRVATLVNSWSGCAAWFFQSCPYFKPKHVILRTRFQTWGPFLESPGNFTGPKSNIQIEI